MIRTLKFTSHQARKKRRDGRENESQKTNTYEKEKNNDN